MRLVTTARTFLAVFFALSTLGLAACSHDGQSSPVNPSMAAKASASTELQPVERAVAELPVLRPATACNIDQIAGSPITTAPSNVVKGEPMTVSGWVVTEDGAQVPKDLTLRLENERKVNVWEVAVPTGVAREDVAKARSNPALAHAGFTASVNISGLDAGRYHLYIAYQNAGIDFGCDNGRIVIVE